MDNQIKFQTFQISRMDTAGPAAVHGTVELASGNREDLFKPYVTDELVNIVCGGCGLSCGNHDTWEEHIR